MEIRRDVIGEALDPIECGIVTVSDLIGDLVPM